MKEKIKDENKIVDGVLDRIRSFTAVEPIDDEYVVRETLKYLDDATPKDLRVVMLDWQRRIELKTAKAIFDDLDTVKDEVGVGPVAIKIFRKKWLDEKCSQK